MRSPTMSRAGEDERRHSSFVENKEYMQGNWRTKKLRLGSWVIVGGTNIPCITSRSIAAGVTLVPSCCRPANSKRAERPPIEGGDRVVVADDECEQGCDNSGVKVAAAFAVVLGSVTWVGIASCRLCGRSILDGFGDLLGPVFRGGQMIKRTAERIG